MAMHPVFLSNDGGFVDRFQHPSASPEQQYGAQHLAVFGEARAPRKFQPVREQLPPPGLRVHPDTAKRTTRNIPRHRMAASQDSNDDDGETSSASEDSALSGGYPSPSRSKTRIPRAKRPEPSIGFSNELSKRTRLLADTQPKWSPASNSCTAAGIFRTSDNTPVRQLPRMAALETFQQPALEYSQQRLQRKQGNHQQSPDRPQHQHQQPPPPPPSQFHPSQESCHLPAVGSHGPTSGMIRAAQMQLPRISISRTPVPPVAPPLASIGPSARVSSSSSSPGKPSACSTRNGSLAAGSHHNRESYQPPQVSYVEAATRIPGQLPTTHTSSNTSNNSGSGGALLRPWLSRDEGECLRQVPRIEALKSDESPLSAMHGAQRRWAPIWSTPAQHHSEPYDHGPAVESGFSGGSGIHGQMWRNPECARRESVKGDWVINASGYQPRPLQGREACQPTRPAQLHPKVLEGPGAQSPRTPSPVFGRQLTPLHHLPQQAKPLPQVNSAPRLPEKAETAEWRCASGSNGSASHRDKSAEEEKQILEKYIAHLNPKASREVWSHDEEEVLWRAQKEYGNAWNYIAGLLPGRSENAVKNHWYTQMRMFIGQRGNPPTNSKPCPPPTALERAKPVAGQGGRQAVAQRKREDSRPEAKARAMEVEGDRQAPAGGNAHEENAARAEAVAALGMLFTTPRC